MNRFLKSVGTVVALALTSGFLVSAWPTAASAAYSPPWGTDANSVGGLSFFNAAGQQLTGGNITDGPIAAYVEGSSTIRSGDTKATLFGYTPVSGVAPSAWSGEQLGASTTYPNAAAPAPLNTASLPVETGGVGDLSIANLATDFPNTDTSTDGYAGVFVLRLKTGAAGLSTTSTYDSAVIQVTGSTWTVLSPVPTTIATTTTLSTTQSSPQGYGTSVQLNATVAPAVPGTVQFEDAGVNIGSPVTVAVDGTASLTTALLPVGTDALSAVFTSTQPLAYSGSTGNASFTVSPLTLSLTPVPTITGPAVVGGSLTAVPGGWDSGVALSYQWLRAGAAIAGATTSTYQVSSADVGKKVRVVVTGSLTGYTSVCLLYTSPSPRDRTRSRMPSSA